MKEPDLHEGCECNCHVSHEGCEECLIIHGIESLEVMNNQDCHEASCRKRGTDEGIRERQNKITKTMIDYPDTTHEELAVKYDVSISTIQRDLNVIQNESLNYADTWAKGGFMHQARIMSNRIDGQISRLQHRINNEELDPKTEAYLMGKINEFAEFQLQLEARPIFQIIKKINDKLASLPEHITSVY